MLLGSWQLSNIINTRRSCKNKCRQLFFVFLFRATVQNGTAEIFEATKDRCLLHRGMYLVLSCVLLKVTWVVRIYMYRRRSSSGPTDWAVHGDKRRFLHSVDKLGTFLRRFLEFSHSATASRIPSATAVIEKSSCCTVSFSSEYLIWPGP